jgi:hypothetical protein
VHLRLERILDGRVVATASHVALRPPPGLPDRLERDQLDLLVVGVGVGQLAVDLGGGPAERAELRLGSGAQVRESGLLGFVQVLEQHHAVVRLLHRLSGHSAVLAPGVRDQQQPHRPAGEQWREDREGSEQEATTQRSVPHVRGIDSSVYV